MRFSRYSFEPELHQNLEALGFVRPTDIQFRAIPSILKGEDVMAIAQTGTGKTAAFAIPLVQRLLSDRHHKPQPGQVRALVMVPTRELALQITDVFKSLVKNTPIRVAHAIGGTEIGSQARELVNADVLVATPGRMFDLRHQGLLDLSAVAYLVLDEADQMLAKGFLKDIQDVLRFIPRRHQTLFFSATLDIHIKELAYSLVHKAIRIQISPKERIAKNVAHQFIRISMDDKRFFLERILKTHPEARFLVFVRTKVRAERVVAAMERIGISCLSMHGNKDQAERIETLDAFRKKENRVLIATDVSARGIDIPGVPFVINYDVPDEPEAYVHRVGRTGRGMEKGNAISFCSPEEEEKWDAIEAFLEQPVEELDIDSSFLLETKALSEQSINAGFSNLLERARKELGLVENIKEKKKRKK